MVLSWAAVASVVAAADDELASKAARGEGSAAPGEEVDSITRVSITAAVAAAVVVPLLLLLVLPLLLLLAVPLLPLMLVVPLLLLSSASVWHQRLMPPCVAS